MKKLGQHYPGPTFYFRDLRQVEADGAKQVEARIADMLHKAQKE